MLRSSSARLRSIKGTERCERCRAAIRALQQAVERFADAKDKEGMKSPMCSAISKVNAIIFGMSSDTKSRHTVAPTTQIRRKLALSNFANWILCFLPHSRFNLCYVYQITLDWFHWIDSF